MTGNTLRHTARTVIARSINVLRSYRYGGGATWHPLLFYVVVLNLLIEELRVREIPARI